MKKFLISFMCLFTFFIYLKGGGKIMAPYAFYSKYGVFTMDRTDIPTMNILEGAQRQIMDKTQKAKSVTQQIVVIPQTFTHFVPYENIKYVEYRKGKK